jgi:hypothetical protein
MSDNTAPSEQAITELGLPTYNDLHKALEDIAKAWDLIIVGRSAEANKVVPQTIADSWAGSFAEHAKRALRK